MRVIFAFLFSIVSLKTIGQYRFEPLVENEIINLNGGFNASFGGKSRTVLPFKIPTDCVGVVYTMTAVNPSKPIQSNFGLVAGLITVAGTGNMTLGSAVSKIEIPAGNQSADLFLLPSQQDAILFETKKDGQWKHIFNVCKENRSSCSVLLGGNGEFRTTEEHTMYLGLRNPSTLNPVTITINISLIFEQ